MIRQLARCPYCNGCEITLNDSFEVVFNPDSHDRAPCEHLIWANGGCSQWERMLHGVSRVIGSTAIYWSHPCLNASGPSESLVPYMEMLVQSGKGWEFAPLEPFQIQNINEEGTTWEADGWAVFARRPGDFLAAIIECRETQDGVWKDAAGQQTKVSVPADPEGPDESKNRWRNDGGQGGS